MKKETYLLFTAGRGPEECGLAVHGIQRKFRKYLESKGITHEIVNQKQGQTSRSIETIVFKLMKADKSLLNEWTGTIQWICKSPIRKYNKRKNWYIKCEEITLPDLGVIDTKDLAISSYRASGPGGQHRNKVETAIRIIHKKTGPIVTASDSRSKAQNKKRALTKLKEKLEFQNSLLQADHNLSEWTKKIEIERGNPVKIFSGTKFIEL